MVRVGGIIGGGDVGVGGGGGGGAAGVGVGGVVGGDGLVNGVDEEVVVVTWALGCRGG